MPTEKEGFPYKESEFDKLLRSKEMDSWHFVGRESLTQDKFSAGFAKEGPKFVAVPYQTEDSIKEKYLQIAKQQDPTSEFKIDLVLYENTDKLRRLREIGTGEEYRNVINNLREEDKVYYVFVKKIEK